jgi:hypothetical protein
MGKSYKVLVVVVLAVLVLFAATDGTVWAEGVWMEGKVTRAAWQDRYRHIEVNNIPFMLTELATVYERVKNVDGSFSQPPLGLNRIMAGQSVLIRHQGHRIHEIIVLR